MILICKSRGISPQPKVLYHKANGGYNIKHKESTIR